MKKYWNTELWGNNGLLYCFYEYLVKNVTWILMEIPLIISCHVPTEVGSKSTSNYMTIPCCHLSTFYVFCILQRGIDFTNIQVMELPWQLKRKRQDLYEIWYYFGPNCRQKDIKKSVVNFLQGWVHWIKTADLYNFQNAHIKFCDRMLLDRQNLCNFKFLRKYIDVKKTYIMFDISSTAFLCCNKDSATIQTLKEATYGWVFRCFIVYSFMKLNWRERLNVLLINYQSQGRKIWFGPYPPYLIYVWEK